MIEPETCSNWTVLYHCAMDARIFLQLTPKHRRVEII
jgi:hypothetical protein